MIFDESYKTWVVKNSQPFSLFSTNLSDSFSRLGIEIPPQSKSIFSFFLIAASASFTDGPG